MLLPRLYIVVVISVAVCFQPKAAIVAIKAELEISFAKQYGTAPMVAPMSAVVVEAWK